MPSSVKVGSLVFYQQTQLRYTVVRRDETAGLVLLTPATHPSTNLNSSSSTFTSAADKNTSAGKRARTRWAFEHMVDLIDESVATTPPETRKPYVNCMKSDAAALPLSLWTEDAHIPSSCLVQMPIPAKVNFDPNPYMRRVARLDSRVEVRFEPERGRGLVALQDIPKGTEIMRAPATAAVILRPEWEGCAGCLLPKEASGHLTACLDCSQSFCADCDKCANGGRHLPRSGGSGNGSGGIYTCRRVSCKFTRQLKGICVRKSGQRTPDEGTMRLLADVLIRRKTGKITDEEWNMLNSLESHDNEARAMSLPTSELRKCVKLFKDVAGIELSEEDVQTMCRRITRNANVVSPNSTRPGFGSIQGIFPSAALVNHSCLPNSFFHCVSEPSSVDGLPMIKHVLRTIREVQAGEELCYSYLASGTTALPMLDRRSLLKSWDFLCACKRCLDEVNKTMRLSVRPTPVEQKALRLLKDVPRDFHSTKWENAPATRKTLIQDVERMVQLLSEVNNNPRKAHELSPVLRTRMVMTAVDAVEVIQGMSDLLRYGVYGFAVEELSEVGDPTAIIFCYKQFKCSRNAGDGDDLDEEQVQLLRHVKNGGINAVGWAAQLCALFFGENHKESIRFRKIADAAAQKRMGLL